MNTAAIKVRGNEKLLWLQRLDQARSWESLDDQRRCLYCGKTFSGREVRLVGGTRPFGPLHLLCPTDRCDATPADWIYLDETPAEVPQPTRFPTVRVAQIKRKRAQSGAASRIAELSPSRLEILRSGFRILHHIGLVT